jgi:pyruvate/2-oxoglutarate dehydrogenase complex dihydrolipoamide dehydrogenase (E3) component
MSKQFDVVAIGTGAGASAVAMLCRAEGWQVAIVDSRPFGGTCALRGCDPKKVNWRFKPPTCDGVPYPAPINVEMSFR